MVTSRKRVRYTFDVHFLTTEEKDVFVQRLNNVRRLLTSAGSPLLDNFSLMSAFCDAVEGDSSSSQTSTSSVCPAVKSFMSNSGKHCTAITMSIIVIPANSELIIGIYKDKTPSPDNQCALFITEKHCFSELVTGLATPCPCGVTRNSWKLENVVQVERKLSGNC